ncbi:MAG TPA: prenyltransferase/squalene oxidase repeat-containing protein, partial [bacterium]|nr:prenyltransferase/squalene oxidase repeat-containing protein [bacterium]
MINKTNKIVRILARSAARNAVLRDMRGIAKQDPGTETVLQAGFDWLARAQDRSSSADGGVSRHFNLLTGWDSSYPETTGYILNTWVERASTPGHADLEPRIQKAVDWLCSIQLPEGGFPGGVIGENQTVPVVFNTGQIVLGLAATASTFNKGRAALIRAADWLVAMQGADGGWHRGERPYAPAGAHTSETHVAWGLIEAAKVTGNSAYSNAALKNVHWALSLQSPTGWFNRCSFWEPDRTLTHTIGYVLRGVLEAWRFTSDSRLLAAARLTADALMRAQRKDGSIPGCFNSNWNPTAQWICLTGVSQIALCWMRIYETTREPRYLNAA